MILHRRDRRIDLGMYDPRGGRYEPLGTHGPDPQVISSVIRGLKERMEREGHRVTYCEKSKD